MKLKADNPIVYSTEKKAAVTAAGSILPATSSGRVYLQRQTAGRHGKAVIVIRDLAADKATLMAIATQLKKQCGCGGTVKQDTIEIQGDKRELIENFLGKKGYLTKWIGG